MQTFTGKFLSRGGGGASRSTNSPLPRYVVNSQEGCGVGRGEEGGWTAFSKLHSVVLPGHDLNQQRMDWVGGFLVLP